MKLLNDLFEITENSANQSGLTATIKLFPTHLVYAGHFPGHPVTPGVIQLQIVHELIEHCLGKNIKLIAVHECKFLKILNPLETDQLQISIDLDIEDSLLNIKATGKNGADVFFKLNSSYQLITW